MSSLARIKKSLRRLPYMEMRALSTEIRDGLAMSSDRSVEAVAEILASLMDNCDIDDELMRENALLETLFTRKRAIAVQPCNPGFRISMSGTDLSVTNASLRDGLIEFLEGLTALEALGQ